jgi:hopanoid C-2 methylase
VRFLRPHDEVVASWRRAIAHAYKPENLFSRFHHQVKATYPNRLRTPARTKLTVANLKRALVLAANIVWRIGIRSDYRASFWKAARHALRHGQIESVFGMGFVAYHLIRFTREALRGEHNASFYAAKSRARVRQRRLQHTLAQK